MENDPQYIQTCKTFLSTPKSLVIAPAGFGKTYSIADSILLSDKKFLVLTHTHAGVASIRQKLLKNKVNNRCYQIETIAGYCQKYANAFTPKEQIPEQDDSKNYYPFLYNRTIELLSKPYIQQVIQNSYDGVIIDEYQDCNLSQHNLVIAIGDIVPIHILGDEFQAIFDFDGVLVNWEDINNKFVRVGVLTKPWRWIIGGNEPLGNDLIKLRTNLENKSPIKLSDYASIEHIKTESSERNDFYGKFSEILDKEDNLLIIEPDSHNKYKRLNLIKNFKGRMGLLESIDDPDFYKGARLIDQMSDDSKRYELLLELIKGKKLKKQKGKRTRSKPLLTNISEFLTEDSPSTKKVKDKRKADIYRTINDFVNKFSLKGLYLLLSLLKQYKSVRITSYDLYNSLLKAIEISDEKGILVYDSMKEVRNIIRRTGRTLYGRTIGTTLLTKGLEIDCVVVLDATKFVDPKNFYVAFTRATKRLIIFSNDDVLSPYDR